MLVLSRKSNEAIIIKVPPLSEPREIMVFLSEIRHNAVARIGIEVQPPDLNVVILRHELTDEFKCVEKTPADHGN